MRAGRCVATLLVSAAALVLSAGPLAAASNATATRVTLGRDGCTFTAVAGWSRSDVTHVTLHLLRRTRDGSTVANAQLVAVTPGAVTASATWDAAAAATTSSFSAQVNLYAGEPGLAGSVWLGSGAARRNVKAPCEITGN